MLDASGAVVVIQLRNGLALGLIVAVVVRLAAWLLVPALPLLVVLLVVTTLLAWLIRPYSGRGRW